MDQAEASGKTVEDALSRALAKLNATRDEVEFTVLDEGKRGGLFGRGSRDALVRVSRLSPSERTSATSAPPDTRIPRGQQGGTRQGGRTRGGAAGGGQQRRDGGRDGGGGGQRRGPSGARGSVEPVMPRLTDADFARPGGGTGRSQQPQGPAGDGAGAGRRRGRGGGATAEDGERAPRAERPERPERRETRRPRDRDREPLPEIAPDINAPEVDAAAQTVDDILRILAIDADISIREPLTPGDGLGSVLAVIDIKGEDLGLLIGRRGDTLVALQYLVNLILNRKYPGKGGVTIDVEHYRHRNEERIVAMANRMGDRVRESGNPITLEPMSAAERRLVHIIFADDPDLETNSIGDGENRKVVISPRR
jgi:spoIIIJ-associated protein